MANRTARDTICDRYISDIYVRSESGHRVGPMLLVHAAPQKPKSVSARATFTMTTTGKLVATKYSFESN